MASARKMLCHIPPAIQLISLMNIFILKDLSGLYNKYDSIDPACKKICVAEYASSIKGNGGDVIGNFGDALGDAVFMLGCEKNSERMWWTGYGNYGGLAGTWKFWTMYCLE